MPARSRHVVVSTTIDSPARARSLASRIVASRLAACVQTLPIQSHYRWKGRTETTREQLLLAKTRAALAPRLVRFIRSLHPYEVPEIIVTPIASGWAPYLQWIDTETAAPERGRTGARL